MNVYVMVDIEGISGIYTKEQVLRDGYRFDEGRRYMTADVNSCVSGLKAAGVEKVYVYDCHGNSHSLRWEDLNSDADFYVCGDTLGVRYPGLEDCDGVVLLGYHAMAGTSGAVLEHSYNSSHIQNIYMNGVAVGEIAFDAAIAGEHQKPIIMVSGDDKACGEAEALLSGVTTACVKKGMGSFGAMLLPPKKAHELLFEKAKKAVENWKNCKPYTFAEPMECVVEVTERTVINNACNVSYMSLIDGRSFKVTGDTTEEILNRIKQFT